MALNRSKNESAESPELLLQVFEEINAEHFDGFLDPPLLVWNAKLRTSAGRFFPGGRVREAKIEVASYLLEVENASTHIRDTLAHEMIHFWLWVRRKPYGHTDTFWEKMQAMGVSRYNSVARKLPFKYVYACESCRKEFKARRRLGMLACLSCCKAFSQGKYDARFRLILIKNCP